MRVFLLALMMMLSLSAMAIADVPPAGSLPLSQILKKVEARDKFGYIGEVDFDDGFYEVTWYTTDGAKVEEKLDPHTGDFKVK
jgi:hypothetical protein